MVSVLSGVSSQYILSIEINKVNIPISTSNLHSFSFFDGMDEFLPTFQLIISDKDNVIRDYIVVSGGAKCVITFGENTANRKSYDCIISNIKSSSSGTVEGIDSLIILEGFLDIKNFISPVKNRSFVDKASEIVKKIGKECNLNVIVEDTKTTETWIQAYWTNAQFIRYLTTRSINNNNIGGYLFYIRRDKTLMFSTLDYYYKNKSVNYFGQFIKRKDIEILTPINWKIYNRAYTFGVSGMGGVVNSYWDWENNRYEKSIVDVTKVNKKSGENDFILENEQVGIGHRFYYWGTETNKKARKYISYNNLFHKIEKSLKLKIVCLGIGKSEVGDRVEVKIPNKEIENAGTYEGIWVVYRKITFIRDIISTSYILIRDSIHNPNAVKGRNFVKVRKVSI